MFICVVYTTSNNILKAALNPILVRSELPYHQKAIKTSTGMTGHRHVIFCYAITHRIHVCYMG